MNNIIDESISNQNIAKMPKNAKDYCKFNSPNSDLNFVVDSVINKKATIAKGVNFNAVLDDNNDLTSLINHFKAWFRVYEKRPKAKIKLLCLPHAGGSASFFREWAHLMPSNIEVIVVQYPGHEDRIDEPLIDDMHDLVKRLAQACIHCNFINSEYMIFGHSMGGYIAWELVQELQMLGVKLPSHMVVSGSEAPNLKNKGNWHKCADNILLNEINRLFSHSEALAENSEISKMVLPIIRNDYRLVETWEPDKLLNPLAVPISAFYGQDDTEMTKEQAEGWHKLTTKTFDIKSWEGEHFYLINHQNEVISNLVNIAKNIYRSTLTTFVLP